VVTICTASLTFSNSTFCPHSVFMCFVWISEQTAIISLYNINWLVFIVHTECVYCAVRTGYLYIIQVSFRSLRTFKVSKVSQISHHNNVTFLFIIQWLELNHKSNTSTANCQSRYPVRNTTKVTFNINITVPLQWILLLLRVSTRK
jgi:hypothetical protein